MAKLICAECGKEIQRDGVMCGYGRTVDGKILCYDCCAKHTEKEFDSLPQGEKTYLYLVSKNGDLYVTDWTGRFSIPVYRHRKGRHNIAGTRTDVWFSRYGKKYHGVNYGEFSQICHIKQVKA